MRLKKKKKNAEWSALKSKYELLLRPKEVLLIIRQDMLTGMCISTFTGDLFAVGLTYPVTLISANFFLWHSPTCPHVMSVPGCAFVCWSLIHQSRLGSNVLSPWPSHIVFSLQKGCMSYSSSPPQRHVTRSVLHCMSSSPNRTASSLYGGELVLRSSQLLPELSIRQNSWQLRYKRSCVVPAIEWDPAIESF